MVSRSLFDRLKEDLGATRNDLDTQRALLSRSDTERDNAVRELISERDLNRQQENKIAGLQADYRSLQFNFEREQILNDKQQSELDTHRKQLNILTEQLSDFRAQNNALIEKLDTQKKDILDMAEKNRLEFQEMAEKLLKEKSSEFTDVNKKNIERILTPLQDKIKTFEKKIEDNTKESIDRHSSLKQMVKQVSDQSQRVAEDANNLAKALKGDFKKQGNWGELILQSILDKSGLEKDREYFLQEALRDKEGKLQKPDVVIYLPDNKRLIIDSKVSLVAYEAMVNADSSEAAEKHAKNHALAVKHHINGLTSKNYQDLYQIESPDFVLMFIPIDTAFSAALRYDETLYDYAFSKNIIIVTASTLLASLKTIESLWKNDKQNRFAMEIASEAGKMYDKFVGFVEDLDKMGKQLNTVQNTYTDSMKKLNTGSGNLVRRAEKIKELGANANKALPEKLSMIE
jgi:DNA recombination protein RmuC